MGKGTRYIVGGSLSVYATADDAINRRNPSSTLTNTSNSVEGAGESYIDTSVSYKTYYPAVLIWFMPSWGGSGYAIGWVNDYDNYQATQPSLSPSTQTMGYAITINLPRNNSAITHHVSYSFNGKSDIIATSAGTSVTWTPPTSLAYQVTNSTVGSGTITVKSYDGSRLIGTKTASFRLYVPSGFIPSISHAISEAVAGLATKFSAYIQNKSKLKVVSSASGSYGSTIKSIITTIEGSTYSGANITSSTLSNSGSQTVTTTVIDSRGRKRSVSSTISVLAYNNPRIPTFSINRALSDGTLDDSGTFASVSFSVIVTSLDGKNDKSYKIEYRKTGDTSWQEMTSGSAYVLNTTVVSSTAILDTDSSYEIKATVGDYFLSRSFIGTVGTTFVTFDVNASGKGFAFGKVSEKDALEFAMPIYAGMNRIQEVQDPLSSTDAATKAYVDSSSVRTLSFSADYKVHGSGNYIAAIQNNWDAIPTGISMIECSVASRGIAIVYKYQGGDYGFAMTIGLATFMTAKYYNYSQGTWTEKTQ